MDVIDFSGPAEWDSWLDARHEDRTEAWLRIGKRHSGAGLITISDALDVALCKACDDVSFLQRYSRRRPGSSWSKINVAKAEALIAAGRMRPAGLLEIQAAQTDGRWDAAYEPQRTAVVPADLTAALAGNPSASATFERLDRSARYALILPLLKARTPEMRARTLARTVERLADQAG